MPWSIISLAVCFLAFGALACWFPCNPGQPRWFSRDTPDDMLYWGVALIFYGGLTAAIVKILIDAGFGAGAGAALHAVHAGYGWLPRLPLIAQIGLVLVITDFAQYWLHRAFHTARLWPFHAVHHSAEHVDWTTTFRVHPVNYVAYSTSVAVLIQLMGFSPLVFVVLAPFNLASGAMVHANLNWTFGPLKYVFSSPVFHRWHHVQDPAVRDKNFAPTFSCLDLIFGTFYMPAGVLPEGYGVEGAPTNFLSQMVYPFRPLLDRLSRPRKPGAGLAAGPS